jgi:hypothetical protein
MYLLAEIPQEEHGNAPSLSPFLIFCITDVLSTSIKSKHYLPTINT